MTTTIIKTPFPFWGLLSLSSAYFMVGTSSLSVIGLTWEISEGLAVSPADIAFLVTVFALTFAVAAPLTQVYLSHLPRIRILCTGLTILAIALVIAAFAEDYMTLFLSRALMGLGAASVSPMCSAIGAGLAAPEQQGRAMGIVFGGLTVASVLGTPLCAYLGHLIGWRYVFLLLAVCAILSAITVWVLVKDRQAGAETSLVHLLQAFIRKKSALAILMTFLLMTSIFSTYALIAPYMSEKFGLAENLIAVVLLTFGVSGVAGNVVSGRLSDFLGSRIIICLSLFGVAAGLLLIWMIGPSLPFAFAGLVIWASSGMMFHSPQQQLIANIEPERRSLLLALNAAALYLGLSAGSYISNQVYVNFGYQMLPVASLVILSICIVVFLISLTPARKT
jgi:DHA1 family inner membrane transport protein